MNKHTSNQLLDELARESLGQDINLSSDLMIKVRKEKNKNMKKRTLITSLAVLSLVVAILLSVPSVVQAIQRLLGYIPGVGFVEESVPLRILQEAVEIKHKEIKVLVSQAVTDSEHMRLFYQVENLPVVDAETIQTQDLCHALPKLKLPDGTLLDSKTIAGNFWGSGYSRQLEFTALPAQENSATLVLSCFEGSQSKEDKAVEVALTFVQAPVDMTVYPIVELPTPTAQATTQAPLALVDQISLILNKYVQAEGQLILIGALSTDSEDFTLSLIEEPDIHLTDALGNNVVIFEDYTLQDPEVGNRSAQYMPLTYRTAGSYVPGEAKLMIDRVWIDRNSDVSFTFDPGSNSQPGQIWTINKTLEVDGHEVTIKEITRSLRGEGLSFSYQTTGDVTNVSMMDLEHPLLGGGGGSDSTGFSYLDGFPTGVITVTLFSYSVQVTGPWQTSVDLPAITVGSAPTPLPGACLTQSAWTSALNSGSQQIPADLGGQLILENILPSDNLYHVMSTTTSGSIPLDLGLGDEGSLSPDGKTLIFSTDEGLVFRDMVSGDISLVAGTSRRDRGAIWSPDGSLIAFSKGPASGLIGAPGPYELMIMDADGSNQRYLLANNGSNTAQAWLPDGKTLIYTTRQADGVVVQSINIETGAVLLLTQVNYQNAGIAVSPDGKQIAYEAMLPGDRYGVYISNLDGSNARLIANADPIVVTEPYWSPDGHWLMMSVQDTSLSEYMPTLALVNVESCQIIPVMSLQGYVTSWK